MGPLNGAPDNAKAAEAILEAKGVLEFSERKKLYTIALEEMAREVPHVYVGSSYRYVATRESISGFRMDQKLDTFDFRYVEKK